MSNLVAQKSAGNEIDPTATKGELELLGRHDTEQFVTVTIAGQLFGLPVLSVHDILGPQKITKVPLAPPEIAGSLNLRGKIVTAINVRQAMGLPPRESGLEKSMHVVVEHEGNGYSFMVDTVGEVLNLGPSEFEKSPATLDPRWLEVSAGVYRLPEQLMIVLDIDKLIEATQAGV